MKKGKGNVILFHLCVHEQISFRGNFTVIMTISNGLDFQKYSLECHDDNSHILILLLDVLAIEGFQ